MIDVVYLKNGSVIKGKIIEMTPGETIKIETADGSVFVYEMTEVERITKENIVKQVIEEKQSETVFLRY